MTAAYELFMERQEAEDEASGRPIGVPIASLRSVGRKCHSCPRPVSDTNRYYCERHRDLHNAVKRRRAAKAKVEAK